MEKVSKVESLREIIEEMGEDNETSENPAQDCSETMNYSRAFGLTLCAHK